MRYFLSILLALGVAVPGSGEETNADLPQAALRAPDAPEQTGMRLEMVGTTITPHIRAEGLTFAPPTEGPLGARIQFFVQNAGEAEIELSEVLINREYPVWPILEGDWSWHDTPNEWHNRERRMPPGALSVWTVNAVRPTWGEDGRLAVMVRDWRTDNFAVATAHYAEPDAWISSITFLGEDSRPDRAVIHVRNGGDTSLHLGDVRIWMPESKQSYRYLFATDLLQDRETWPADGVIPPGEHGIVIARFAEPPLLSYGAVELETRRGEEADSLWGHVRVKRDVFDIAGGWVNSRTRDGGSTVLHEPFLKTLKRLHINSAHIPTIPGYNDEIGSGGLYDRYPLKTFYRVAPDGPYNDPEMVAHLHGVEFLGEPQLPFHRGHLPPQVLREFEPFAPTALPTTITLNDERTFRHYAGLSDYPHYDAYRVIAPSADVWWRYERWDSRINWGAPLEGISELCRVLRDLSRPRPCAIWSQGPHSGWYEIGGRERLSPTPDELRSQAYFALSTRIISLYWFNITVEALVRFRDTIGPMTEIGREIYMLEDFYMKGDAYETGTLRREDGTPEWELASIVAPHGALLFALDLDYAPDHDEKVFRFREAREAAFTFALPPHLREVADVFRVDAHGVHEVDWERDGNGVALADTATLAAVYVATPDPALRDTIAVRREALLAEEAAWGFDPAENDEDFATLKALLPE